MPAEPQRASAAYFRGWWHSSPKLARALSRMSSSRFITTILFNWTVTTSTPLMNSGDGHRSALNSGALGGQAMKDFGYSSASTSEQRRFTSDRLGCFVRRVGSELYRLDLHTFSLLAAVDEFHRLPVELRTRKDGLLRFGQIKNLAAGVGAQLDRFLESEHVLVPSKIGLRSRR